MRWHVQQAGRGPVCLLVHGTGAATHSFATLLPLLTPHFEVVAIDLPGHGFTSRPLQSDGFSLLGMATALGELLRGLQLAPAVAIGHSAGAAVLLRMCLDGQIAPRLLVSINGALLPLTGFKHPAVTPLLRTFVESEWLPKWFARRLESPLELQRLLAATGSRIDPNTLELYGRLSRSPAHASAALTMMGVWDLRPLEADMARLHIPLHLIVGSADRMILPGEATKVCRKVATARLTQLAGLGHLAHEEDAPRVAEVILEHARELQIVVPS
jgi:magnesium chelatase accessory protein